MMCLLVGVGNAWAQDPDWSATSFSGCSVVDNSVTVEDVKWTMTESTVSAGSPVMAISSGKLKFGSSKSIFFSSYTLSTDAFSSYNVTKVEVGCYDNGGTESSVTVKQGDVTIGSEAVSTTTTANVETLSANSGEGGKLSITFTSTKQASYITSIKVWYSAGADAVNVTGVSLDKHTLSLMATKRATLVATVAPENATNQSVSWSSSDEEVATVEKGVVKGLKEGTATITVKTNDGNFTDECEVTVVSKVPVDATFYESFDKFSGTGGNDDMWSGITAVKEVAADDYDNEGWTIEGSVLEGSGCASIRKSTEATGGTSLKSGLTTPAIGVAGDGRLTFNAQSWGTDTGDFYVDIVGGGTFTAATGVNLSNNSTTAKVALTKKSEWVDYDLSFTGLTADSKFRFYMASGKRGFLDEVAVFVTPVPTKGTVQFVAEGRLPIAGREELPVYFATFSCDKDVIFDLYDESGASFGVAPVGFDDEDGTLSFPSPDESTAFVTDEEIGVVTGHYVPANTGVLLVSFDKQDAPYYYVVEDEANELEEIDPDGLNLLRAASVAKTGNFKFYKLAYEDSTMEPASLGFYYGAADGAAFESRAGSAYLAVPADAANAKGFRFVTDDATAIKSVENNKVKTNAVYNLAGQRVSSKSYKGIVIKNGKQMLNK